MVTDNIKTWEVDSADDDPPWEVLTFVVGRLVPALVVVGFVAEEVDVVLLADVLADVAVVADVAADVADVPDEGMTEVIRQPPDPHPQFLKKLVQF